MYFLKPGTKVKINITISGLCKKDEIGTTISLYDEKQLTKRNEKDIWYLIKCGENDHVALTESYFDVIIKKQMEFDFE